MSGWTIIVIALMVILTVIFVAYPLYSAAGGIYPAPSTPSPLARKARKKKRERPSALKGQKAAGGPKAEREPKPAQADEALEKDLEEEIERQVRALRRKKIVD